MSVQPELPPQANQGRRSLVAALRKARLFGERHMARRNVEQVGGDCLACRALWSKRQFLPETGRPRLAQLTG
jgi:hypothetical protein